VPVIKTIVERLTDSRPTRITTFSDKPTLPRPPQRKPKPEKGEKE
jgi:hypothetical protein